MDHPVTPRLTVQQPWAEPIITYRLSQRWTPSQLHPSVLSSSMVKKLLSAEMPGLRILKTLCDASWRNQVCADWLNISCSCVHGVPGTIASKGVFRRWEWATTGFKTISTCISPYRLEKLEQTWNMKHCKRHYFISTVEALVCNFVFYLFMFITFNVCGLFRHVHKHTTRVYSVLRDQKGASRSPISPGTLLSPPS